MGKYEREGQHEDRPQGKQMDKNITAIAQIFVSPPKSLCWNLIPSAVVSGGGAFGVGLDGDGGAPR